MKDAKGEYIPKETNDGYSSFFPDTWDEQKTLEDIAFAYGNKQPVGNKQFEFVGKTTDGIDVTIFIDKSGNITSAFPIFPNTKK